MYAIIQDGGHQYRVEKGQRLRLQRREAAPGDTVSFGQVRLLGGGEATRVGTPFLEGVTVTGRVLRPEVKGRKIEVFFYRRRKGSRRHKGHRQKYTEVEITEIAS